MKRLREKLNAILLALISACLMAQPCGASDVEFLQSIPTSSLTKGVGVSGTLVFVADGEEGVKILDAGATGTPLVGTYDTPGFAFDVVVRGDVLYVADGSGGLLILDIGNPEAVSPLGYYKTLGLAKSVEVSGSYAFLIDYAYGFQIVDVSDPTSPSYAGHSAALGDIWMMRMGDDGYLYIADVGNGLRIWDVGDPGQPVEIGRFDTPGYALDVALAGNRALIADAWNGFLLLDVSDPSDPVELVHIPTDGYAFAAQIVDGFVYLSEGEAGLRIVPLAAFSSENAVGEINIGHSIYATAVYRKLAFSAAGRDGTLILDVFEAIRPRVILALNGSHQATVNPWGALQWDVQVDPRAFGYPGLFAERRGAAYFAVISGDGNLYSLVPGTAWTSGLLPFETSVRAEEIAAVVGVLPAMAGALPGACFIPTREAHAYVGFLSDSDDNGDGFQDLFFDSVDLLLRVTPPEVRVSVNNAEGTVTVPADGRISVHASVLPGDYQETEAVVYAILVVPGTELVLALNEEEEWDSSIVPYRSNISVSSLATFSLVEDIPASIIPAGEYDFYAGILLPYDHDCDGVLDLYYGMARVVVENHDHP
jgi:hypothetical protein